MRKIDTNVTSLHYLKTTIKVKGLFLFQHLVVVVEINNGNSFSKYFVPIHA
jgi:hypothetical protein